MGRDVHRLKSLRKGNPAAWQKLREQSQARLVARRGQRLEIAYPPVIGRVDAAPGHTVVDQQTGVPSHVDQPIGTLLYCPVLSHPLPFHHREGLNERFRGR